MAEHLFTEHGGTMAPDLGAEFEAIVAANKLELDLQALGGEALRPFVPGEVVTDRAKVLWGSAQSSGEEDSDTPPEAL